MFFLVNGRIGKAKKAGRNEKFEIDYEWDWSRIFFWFLDGD